MRILIVLVLVVVVFFATILVPLAMSGNLNAEAMNRLLGREEVSAVAEPEEDPLGPFARKLRERELSLKAREQDIEDRALRLGLRERELDDTLDQLRQIQEQIAQEMAGEDAARTKRLGKMAKMLAAMDARKAAQDLEALSPEDAAEVLLLVKDRTAGSILDEMEHRKRVMVHQILQARRY